MLTWPLFMSSAFHATLQTLLLLNPIISEHFHNLANIKDTAVNLKHLRHFLGRDIHV